MTRNWIVGCAIALIVGACTPLGSTPAPTTPASTSGSQPVSTPVSGPVPGPPVVEADWDGQLDGATWTALALEALVDIGDPLVSAEPSDIAEFCPRYADLDADGRRAFWVGVLSAMSRFESNFDPEASFDEPAHCPTEACRISMTTADGRPVVSRGLLQLSQESANGYRGCPVPPADELRLHEPGLNLRCSVAIMSRWVPADGVISADDGGWRGGARYWSVLRPNDRRTLAQIQAFTRTSALCRNED